MIHLATAVIKPHKLDDVKAALGAAGILGMTASEVKGVGRQGGRTETYRGTSNVVDLLPKVKLEIIVASDDVDKVIDTIVSSAGTGKIGDGKVWSVQLDRLMRIRTGEQGIDAL